MREEWGSMREEWGSMRECGGVWEQSCVNVEGGGGCVQVRRKWNVCVCLVVECKTERCGRSVGIEYICEESVERGADKEECGWEGV